MSALEIGGWLCAEVEDLRTAIGPGGARACAKDDGTHLVEFGSIPEPVRKWLTRPRGALFYMMPEPIREALDLWVTKGQPAGGFVMSVLENNLAEAVSRADPGSFACLRDIVYYLYMECPSPCWGSPEKVAAWAALDPKTRQRIAGVPQEPPP